MCDYAKPEKTLEDYLDRFDFVWGSCVLLLFYHVSYYLLLFKSQFNIISVKLDKGTPQCLMWLANNDRWRVIMVVLYILLFLSITIGNRERDVKIKEITLYRQDKDRAFRWLFFSTMLIMALVMLPIIYLGGSMNSCFSPTLITMCTLIIIITESIPIRVLFSAICLGVYCISMHFNVSIEVVNKTFYNNMYIVSTVISISITYILTWGSKIIFKPTRLQEPEEEGKAI